MYLVVGVAEARRRDDPADPFLPDRSRPMGRMRGFGSRRSRQISVAMRPDSDRSPEIRKGYERLMLG